MHKDIRGYTDDVINIIVKGTLIHNCTKQKINTKSSTESEIVGESDFLPRTIWASFFLKTQEYKLNKDIFYYDNTSTMKMLMNGKRIMR